MSTRTDKRAKEILHLLLRHGKTSIDDLTAELNASPASIRRDLARLEAQGLVHRTHGGAMLATAGQTVYEPFRLDASFQVRKDRFADEKERIARAAAAMVLSNETLGIAAGTTTTLVARHLLHHHDLCVITNAANIGVELSSSTRIQTMLTGGYLRWAGAFSLVGHMAIESLSHFVMDRVFLSATGIDPQHGATIIEREEAAVFRQMARQARQVVIVADSSKVGLVSPSVICPPREIDLLITDNGIPEEAIEAFRKHHVPVLVV